MRQAAIVLTLLGCFAAFCSGAWAQATTPPSESSESATGTDKSPSVVTTVGQEIGRWGRDGLDLTLRPLQWERRDWERFAAFSFVLAGLFVTDHNMVNSVQDHKTSFTGDVRRDTEWLGAWGAVGLSAGLLTAGLIGGDQNVRDMGRDAIEASVITVVLVGALKTVTGRERPRDSNGETSFKPFSGGASFPSSHAAEAFTVASVIATRSEGWAIPAVAYGLATIVGLDRIEANAHFPSDVFAGAALGTAVGHYIATRHKRETEGAPRSGAVQFSVVPMRGGIGAVISLDVGRS